MRNFFGFSQRGLAVQADISYKSLQLIEAGHDTRISTLEKLAKALHYPKTFFKRYIFDFFALPQDSVFVISKQVLETKDWQIPFFNFVDQFRKTKDLSYVFEAPTSELPIRIRALLASTVETLCAELQLEKPWWCDGVPSLKDPYFVAGIENLKAMSLIESSVHFRKRNIFVLGNFLDRV